MQSVPNAIHTSDNEMVGYMQNTSENLATMQADPANSSMVLQASPNIFQPGMNIAEPMTVPNEDAIRI